MSTRGPIVEIDCLDQDGKQAVEERHNYGTSNENLFTLRDVQCAALVHRKFAQFYARDQERARWMQHSYSDMSVCTGLSEQQIARAYEVLRQCELIETAPIGHVYLVDYPNGIPDANPEGDA